ncbi:adenylosuccinate lyase [bacterium]|nr:adenylosuccinate lyase [bacterium]
MDELNCISVVDGRYARHTEELRDIFSEYGLIRHRVHVEVEWLLFILGELKLDSVTPQELDSIAAIDRGFNRESAGMVKTFEATTNHDVKSVEYYIKAQLDNRRLGRLREWVHFCCTSEDINNTSYALMINEGRAVVIRHLEALLSRLKELALAEKSTPMMSRTHGQPATPTTVGKELVNFSARLTRELERLKNAGIECKFSGATGNWNAHFAAMPEVDWIAASENFIRNRLGAKPLLWTTQINNYHYISEIFHILIRISSTLIDLDRDFWTYISLGYLKQRPKAGEVGSSTMPHKINPIDFENSEGNSGVVIALAEHLSVKLLNSRMQRDLTDSTVLRNLGLVFGHLVISLKNCLKGLSKVEVNRERLAADLAANFELLAEPVQTVMRVYGEENPYEKLKELTRGNRVDSRILADFIDSLERVPIDVKAKLKEMTPATYLGAAEALVDRFYSENKEIK